MRTSAPILSGVLVAAAVIFAASMTPPPQEPGQRRQKDTLYTYRGDVLPLLKTNCAPCHFPGGKVYDLHPFDDSTTVARLGRKLNTRLKKKEQQAIITGWVEQMTR